MEKQLQKDPVAYEEWLQDQEKKKKKRIVKEKKGYRDKKMEKKKERAKKKKQADFFYRKENKVARKLIQKKFKATWKQEKNKGRYHIPRAREYKTYGYETW